ncbi:hypothetical protein IJ076_03680 [Candidatus Saccharibacteria bacterium]|nr:hypothetical protein [Candidatus Saccharibacteria bacterium]
MTQELFLTKEKKEQQRLDALEVKAILIWQSNAENYRTLPSQYSYLIEMKRKVGIKPLDIVSKSVLREYPKNELLEIVKEDDARKQVKRWRSQGSLDCRVYELEKAVTNCTFKTLKSRVNDFIFQLRARGVEV